MDNSSIVMMNDTSTDETVNLGPDFDKQVRQEGCLLVFAPAKNFLNPRFYFKY